VPMAASNMEFKRLRSTHEYLYLGWWCCLELLMGVTAFLLLHKEGFVTTVCYPCLNVLR
jgi:hypothetical protein